MLIQYPIPSNLLMTSRRFMHMVCTSIQGLLWSTVGVIRQYQYFFLNDRSPPTVRGSTHGPWVVSPVLGPLFLNTRNFFNVSPEVLQ